jgi:type IV secretory pathway TraG/TraD family ATPase VirD4
MKLKIGGQFETVLLILLTIFGFAYNGIYIHIGETYWSISSYIILIISTLLFVSIIRHNYRKQALKSKINFISSKIPYEDRKEMAFKDGITIGYTTDKALKIAIPYDYLLKHAIILGSTGSGKTTLMRSLMLQNIANGGGAFFIDGKMDYADLQEFYNLLYSIGRHEDLYVISPGNPELSNTYNPVLNGDPQEIASRVISLLPQDARAEFYRNEGYKALETIIAAALKVADAVNMHDLAIMMSNEEALLKMEKDLNSKYPNDPVTMQFSLYLDGYREKDREGNYKINTARLKANISGTAAKPYVFGNGLFGEVTGSYDPDVNLLDCITNNKIVYVLLPTMNKPDAAKEFGKIFMSDFRTVVGWLQQDVKKRPKVPFMVIMDEAGGYANENWDTLFQQCRSARISLFFSAQSTANLKEVSPAFYTKITENTITSIFMKMKSKEGCQDVADLIGQQYSTVYSQTLTKGDNKSGSTKSISESSQGESDNIGYSESQQLTDIVLPKDIRALSTGEAIVFYDGRLIFHVKTPYLVSNKSKKFALNKRAKYKDKVVGLNMKKLLPALLKNSGGAPNYSYGKRAQYKS